MTDLDMELTRLEPSLESSTSVLPQALNGWLAEVALQTHALNPIWNVVPNSSLAQPSPMAPPPIAPRPHTLSPTHGEVVKETLGTTHPSRHGGQLVSSQFSPTVTPAHLADLPILQLIP